MKWKFFSSQVLLLFLIACNITGTLPSNIVVETECLSDLSDGNLRVRAWGSGLNKLDAIQMAQKNVVADLLFKGLTKGSVVCYRSPLLPIPNYREQHANFFEKFFSDNGQYKTFVTVEKVTGIYRIAGSKQFLARVQIRTNVSALQKEAQQITKGN